MLVVSQTDHAHEEIEKLFRDMREVQAKRERPAARPEVEEKGSDPQTLQLRIYRLRARRIEVCGGFLPIVGSVEPSIPANHIVEKEVAARTDRLAPLAQFGGSGKPAKPATGSTSPPATSATSPVSDPFPIAKGLADAIPAMIEPTSWQQAGGEGTIHALPLGGDDALGTLLIRQTPAVHAQVTRLLMQLNASGGLGAPRSVRFF
jgi:hypothetical protein